MEVKPGYKQTEVGVTPDDWEIASLGDLVDPARSIRYGIVQPGKYDPNGRYMIRGQDYSEAKGWASPTEVFRVSAGVEERYRNARVRTDDLIMTIVGYCGHVEQVPAWLDGANLTQTTARIAIDDLRADSQFCKYMLQGSVGKQQVASFLKGAAQPGLNCGDVEKFLLPLPASRTEQRAIATALSDVDALLRGLDRLIAKKRDVKQAAMQQVLTGQTRLPGFHGEWAVTSLAAVCSMKSGEGITSASINEFSQYPCYGGNGLRGFTSRFTHDGSYALIGRQGALCGNVFGVEGQFFASEHAVVVTASENTDIRWLTYVLGRMSLNQYSESSAQPGLSVTKLLNLELAAPPTKDEQTAIATVLSDVDAELAALEARRKKIRDLKQAIMQELLTGKTRLVRTRAAHA